MDDRALPAAEATVRTIFAQTDRKVALLQIGHVADSLREQFPKVTDMLLESSYDVLAFMSFPTEHWRQISSTNPLERLNREIGRRADVVSIFPNRAAVLRLIGAILMEQSDEWAAASRRYLSRESMLKLSTTQPASQTALSA